MGFSSVLEFEANHLKIVTGDPLDETVPVKILEASMGNELAREFMIKTRRRKGLGDRVDIAKYFDLEQVNLLLSFS